MNIASKFDASTDTDDLWFKDAIIYQLHVKAFADSNNDGIGDFRGLTERLDYLQDLGVTALWLLPFYPSPGRDDGYDIADYGRVNSEFGNMKDFRRFMQEAKRRNLRVITELVINHTSDQHPWFRRARRSHAGSSARNWYVWSDTDEKFPETRIIFTDTEKSNWTWDPEARAFYWHRFFSHQPDLNFDNPRVLKAVIQVMKRWLDAGVDGFRLDAIPYLVEREGTNNENLPETHDVIKRIRAALDDYAPGKLLLAEANQWPEDVSAYFGDGDECHMAYHFPVMPRIYMAIAQEDRFPIADILRQTPEIPSNCQWALFLRNHDELTLEMVTDVERDYLWSTYASDPRARINLGIRRRLAPLMDNDRRKIELMTSLLFSLPGTPILYYGDEIGMGDNIYLGDRNGVRTPMQWTSDRNGGFSRCDPARLFLPMIMDAVYGYQTVNVESQQRNISSLLNWTKRLIGVRRSTRVFGRGSLSFIRPKNRAVLVYVRQHDDETILCVANMSRSAQSAEIDLRGFEGWTPQEMLGRARFPRITDRPYTITLPPYGFFWFSLLQEETESIREIRTHPGEFETLVMPDGWAALRSGRARSIFERDVLPGFLMERRWFGAKGSAPPTVRLESLIPFGGDGWGTAIGLIDVSSDSQDEPSRYVLPMKINWSRFDRIGDDIAHAAAAVRRGPREGTLLDAGADREFIESLLRRIHAGDTIAASDRQSLELRATDAFREMPPPEVENAAAINREQSNTTIIVDLQYVVKVLRQVHAGMHPEIEIGRFLVEAGFKNAPPLLGSMELVEGDAKSAVAVVHQFIDNQGDAWAVTSAHLDRFIDEQRLVTMKSEAESPELAAYLHRISQIGRRTAELHSALASRSDLPDFAPEPITGEDVSQWAERLQKRSDDVLDLLWKRVPTLDEADGKAVRSLLDMRSDIAEWIHAPLPSDALKIRHHGDFHLGQVLMVKEDAVILDFEGEPRRSLQERRQKAPAARDIAGLIRSIDYSTTAALNRTSNLTPEERALLDPKLDTWREQATAAFWAACREAGDPTLWPSDEADAQRLLDFFLLEKAFYEIEYELMNRPGWLHVPLVGTRHILSRRQAVNA